MARRRVVFISDVVIRGTYVIIVSLSSSLAWLHGFLEVASLAAGLGREQSDVIMHYKTVCRTLL